MSEIDRVHADEIADGNTIFADPLNDEFDQLVNAHNDQENRLETVEAGVFPMVTTNNIAEGTPGSGVTADGVRLKDGLVKVAGAPTAAGEIGYESNRLKYHNGSTVITLPNFPYVSSIEARSSDTILAAADIGKLLVINGSNFTQTFTAAATLGANWFVHFINTGAGVWTLDPNSTETIGTIGPQTTYKIRPGMSGTILCDGTGFVLFGNCTGHVIHYREVQASGTDGGDIGAETWTKRTLNNTLVDETGLASLASSVITLPPGRYEFDAKAPAYACNGNAIRLRNTSDGSTVAQSTNAQAASSSGSVATLTGVFLIAASKNFELQHIADSARATDGLGIKNNITGESEIYADIVFRRIG